jgi:AraC-like DNA-binding protein/mannose-6-phosphate isomerase-like protein (cupin superfamily)
MSGSRKIDHATVFATPDLPLRVVRLADHGATPIQHGHSFHELVLILAGRGTHAVGDETYRLRAGDVFVVLGDTTHGYPETDRLSLINILYDPAHLGFPIVDLGVLPGYHALFTVEPQVRRRQKFKSRLRLGMRQLAHTTELVAHMEEEFAEKRRGYKFMAVARLMELIGYLSRCYSQLELEETRPVAQISELLGYMEQHYDDPLTVADLAQVACMSQTTLMRTFGRIMGRSPIDHLIRLRISKAKELLRTTGASVTDIAFQVGFNDSNYFSRQFRQVNATSPREYRRQCRSRAFRPARV